MANTETKVAVVTGASQGIGAALVQGFRGRGYRVIAISRSIKSSTDANVVTVQGDVADPKTADLVFKEALDRFGRLSRLRPIASGQDPSTIAKHDQSPGVLFYKSSVDRPGR